ncbi:MAG TPA: DUF1289 domain-containing protein [Steroidobacteraceae bacterium]|nr:DUF1289 domain-containing protein [Steroidobacteraceae bacterium]
MSVAHTPGSPPLPLSPCIRHCTLDDENVCVGCGRHIDEIVGWSKFSVEQQRAVVERSSQRREQRKNSFER